MKISFWDDLLRTGPIIGLSPMDGVTDAACRYMAAKYGRATKYSSTPVSQYTSGEQERENDGYGVDVIFTEFVSVDGLRHAKDPLAVDRLMRTLIRAKDVVNNQSRSWPYEVAQVFGHTPELFYQAAVIVATLGYDGMDINMGCPAHKVEEHGSGAGLIRTPAVAQGIVRQAKKGIEDWAARKVGVNDLEVSGAVKEWVKTHARGPADPKTRKVIPVSVKTRIGVDHDVAEEWMAQLMEVEPAMISLHGRTLKQLYQGQADWEAIGRAAEVVHRLGGHILGNGDVGSIQDAKLKVQSYGVDGVLIGRAAEGNPGIFVGEVEPSWEQRKKWMAEHSKKFEELFGQCHGDTVSQYHNWFVPMRKHLAWYCKGFPGASELRAELVRVNSVLELEEIIRELV